ncbi:hypothetical protein KFE25_005536 [Diacronema lutheri]|uniref:Uncharacterized protein n=1 Tax=Diacronema lutheri TaxID=2081491 RepID=A0A8J6CCC9_DIALT|nr:hypothetical protein KFE25_005536 [Diacronema lutheri]
MEGAGARAAARGEVVCRRFSDEPSEVSGKGGPLNRTAVLAATHRAPLEPGTVRDSTPGARAPLTPRAAGCAVCSWQPTPTTARHSLASSTGAPRVLAKADVPLPSRIARGALAVRAPKVGTARGRTTPQRAAPPPPSVADSSSLLGRLASSAGGCSAALGQARLARAAAPPTAAPSACGSEHAAAASRAHAVFVPTLGVVDLPSGASGEIKRVVVDACSYARDAHVGRSGQPASGAPTEEPRALRGDDEATPLDDLPLTGWGAEPASRIGTLAAQPAAPRGGALDADAISLCAAPDAVAFALERAHAHAQGASADALADARAALETAKRERALVRGAHGGALGTTAQPHGAGAERERACCTMEHASSGPALVSPWQLPFPRSTRRGASAARRAQPRRARLSTGRAATAPRARRARPAPGPSGAHALGLQGVGSTADSCAQRGPRLSLPLPAHSAGADCGEGGGDEAGAAGGAPPAGSVAAARAPRRAVRARRASAPPMRAASAGAAGDAGASRAPRRARASTQPSDLAAGAGRTWRPPPPPAVRAALVAALSASTDAHVARAREAEEAARAHELQRSRRLSSDKRAAAIAFMLAKRAARRQAERQVRAASEREKQARGAALARLSSFHSAAHAARPTQPAASATPRAQLAPATSAPRLRPEEASARLPVDARAPMAQHADAPSAPAPEPALAAHARAAVAHVGVLPPSAEAAPLPERIDACGERLQQTHVSARATVEAEGDGPADQRLATSASTAGADASLQHARDRIRQSEAAVLQRLAAAAPRWVSSARPESIGSANETLGAASRGVLPAPTNGYARALCEDAPLPATQLHLRAWGARAAGPSLAPGGAARGAPEPHEPERFALTAAAALQVEASQVEALTSAIFTSCLCAAVSTAMPTAPSALAPRPVHTSSASVEFGVQSSPQRTAVGAHGCAHVEAASGATLCFARSPNSPKAHAAHFPTSPPGRRSEAPVEESEVQYMSASSPLGTVAGDSVLAAESVIRELDFICSAAISGANSREGDKTSCAGRAAQGEHVLARVLADALREGPKGAVSASALLQDLALPLAGAATPARHQIMRARSQLASTISAASGALVADLSTAVRVDVFELEAEAQDLREDLRTVLAQLEHALMRQLLDETVDAVAQLAANR